MKCNHDVTSYQWQKCSRCGRIVRVNHKREIIRGIFIVVSSLIIAPLFADWVMQALHLNEHNPNNLTHALIGLAPIFLICSCAWRLFPYFDEKEQE